MTADAELTDAVRALVDVRSRRTDLQHTEDTLEAAIKARMADASRLVGDGWVVSWKRTKDGVETDWKAIAADLMAPLAEPDRAAVVGAHSTVRRGFRPFRVSWGKGETE